MPEKTRLRKLSPDVWVVDHHFKIGALPMQSRMTLVLLAPALKGEKPQWVAISAVPLQKAELAEIKSIGEMAYIVAPNKFHHLYIKDLQAHFPNANLYIPRGLKKKRPDLVPAACLDDVVNDVELVGAWKGSLDIVKFEGCNALEEYLFYHRSSGSLIVTDVCFNYSKPSTFVEKIWFYLMDISGGLKSGRHIRWIVRDKKAAAKTIEDLIAGKKIARLILNHGEIIEENAQSRFRQAMAWLTDT